MNHQPWPGFSGAKYNYYWGEEILKRFRKKHTRATDLLGQKCSIHYRLPILWLCFGKKEWVAYRETVKILSRQLKKQENIGILTASNVRIIVNLAVDRMKKYLTDVYYTDVRD